MNVGTLIWVPKQKTGWIFGLMIVLASPAAKHFPLLVNSPIANNDKSFAFYSFEKKAVFWTTGSTADGWKFEIVVEGV